MIRVDSVDFDPVIQQDGGDWIVAESDGTVIYSRHPHWRAAASAHARLLEGLKRKAARAAPR